MPLSEQEQRLLDEMERSLYHGDAEFVAAVNRVRVGVNYTAIIGGILLAIGGVGLLIGGVALHAWIVGVLGFAAMFAGVLLAMSRRPAGGVRPRRRNGLMERLGGRVNGRFDRRRRI